jgi:excisionase family DNA binding protein
MPQRDRLLTLQQVAELLGCSVLHVQRLISNGVLNTVMISGRERVIVPEWVEEEAS